MKGSILDTIKDLVTEKFGKDGWMKVLENAGLEKTTHFGIKEDIPDITVINIIDSVAKTFSLSKEEVFDAFGEYWTKVYMKKVYKPYLRGVYSAKDLLLKLDEIHSRVIHDIPNAHPPRFDYEWKDKKTLIMRYKSKRNLFPIFMGLLKGVAKTYNTPLKFQILDDNVVKIIFPEN